MHALDTHTSKSQPLHRFYKFATQFPSIPLNILIYSSTPTTQQTIQGTGLSFYTPQAATQSLPPLQSSIYHSGTLLPSITPIKTPQHKLSTPSTGLTNHTLPSFNLPSFSTNQSIFPKLQGPTPQIQWANLPMPSISQLPNTLQNFLAIPDIDSKTPFHHSFP